jgi:tryptophan halogenase
MEHSTVRRVVVAGGGTAGWIAAFALAKQLGGLIDITLVESDEIGTVGVGESTIPTSRTFHQYMGVDEREFVHATQSTFKLGISFENWGAEGDRYIHSFGTLGRGTWMADFHHFWLEARAQSGAADIGEYCLEHQAAAAGKFATSQNGTLNYAYHLDATAYGRYLRGLAEKLGVRRVEGKIEEVVQNSESGDIQALRLNNETRVEGDLFLDCTGFRGLLIEQTLKAGFDDWRHWLPTDSALPVQTESVGPPKPFTRAIAHKAGWRWMIPLQHRVGNGLVFASEFMGEEEARRTLAEGLEGEALFEPRMIRFAAGRRRKSWVKNCVAMGLSGGFIEPLESTSIHLIMIAVTRLLQSFPFGGISPATRDRFNEQSDREIVGIRDFIILHYHVTQRADSEFWRHCRHMKIPESLAERIELFRSQAHAYQDSHDLFRVDSWVQVLLGQRVQPASHHHAARLMPASKLQEALTALQGNIERAVQAMPTHGDFLRSYVPSNA